MALQLDIVRSSKHAAAEPAAALVREMLPRAAKMLERSPGELCVALVDDDEMADLHERHLNIAGPTDVLTFELEHDAAGRVLEGEVAVCVPEAARQAAARGHDVEREGMLYALHGLLHLSGYDDLDPQSYATMHAREDEILTKLGIGRVFDV